MKLPISLLALTTIASLVHAAPIDQNAYANAVVNALNAANLTTLATLLQSQPNLVQALNTNASFTVFAPSNAAFDRFLATLNGTQPTSEQVDAVLRYHVVSGTIRQADLKVEHAVVPTLSQASGLGQNAANFITAHVSEFGPVILTAERDISIGANATVDNIQLHVIDDVLPLPTAIPQTLQTANLTSLLGAATQTIPNVTDLLSGPQLTIFAPVDAAFTTAAELIGTLNATQIASVIANHVIKGTVAFSSAITNETTASSIRGQPFRFTKNGGNIYVQSGDAPAVGILRADIPSSNGVVHLIEQVLANAA